MWRKCAMTGSGSSRHPIPNWITDTEEQVMTAVTRRTETHVDVQHTTDTARTRWRALSAWAGIAFVPVFFFGVFFASNLPDSNDSDAKVSAWYADSSHRTWVLIGAYALIVSAVLFLGFAAGTHERLRSGRAQSPVAYRLIGWTAGVFAALVIVGAIQFAGVVGNLSVGDVSLPNPDLLRQNIGYPFIFVGGALVVAVHMAAVATVAGRLGAFRTWLVVLSYVFAVVLVFAVIFTPMAALLVWTLIVAIVQLTQRDAPQPIDH
jgi:hypothetical protein